MSGTGRRNPCDTSSLLDGLKLASSNSLGLRIRGGRPRGDLVGDAPPPIEGVATSAMQITLLPLKSCDRGESCSVSPFESEDTALAGVDAAGELAVPLMSRGLTKALLRWLY